MLLQDLSDQELLEYYSLFKKASPRALSIKLHGADLKFLYHVVRLMRECEMILAEQDLDLERSREELKSIRRGEWTLDRVEELFQSKEKSLEELYHSSTLPYSPNKEAIKNLLIECLEMHYGKLDSNIVVKQGESDVKLEKIRAILDS